jgi:hypothetical protein
MKIMNKDFTTAMNLTANTIPVCLARLASAEPASAISDDYASINLRVDAVKLNQRHWGNAAGRKRFAFRPVLHEK